MKTVLKVLTALATIAGIVYVIAAYGDKIVATCKKLLAWCTDCGGAQVVLESDFVNDTEEDTPSEATTEEDFADAPAEAETVDVPAADETAPIADEEDFEG